MQTEIEKSVAISGLEALKKDVAIYLDDIVSKKVPYPFGIKTCQLELSETDKDNVCEFVDKSLRSDIDSLISRTLTEYKDYPDDRKIYSLEFAHKLQSSYFGSVENWIYNLPIRVMQDISIDIKSYVVNCYYKIIELEKKMLTPENKLSPYDEYAKSLLDIYNQCRNRRERISFISSLIEKSLVSGLDIYCPYCDRSPSWVRDGEGLYWACLRIIKVTMDEFWIKNQPIILYPTTGKLRKFLKCSIKDKMPLDAPLIREEFAGREKEQCEQEIEAWNRFTIEMEDSIDRFIETICSRYKKHVPILCRAKFPEWAVKWVYDLTVKGEKS